MKFDLSLRRLRPVRFFVCGCRLEHLADGKVVGDAARYVTFSAAFRARQVPDEWRARSREGGQGALEGGEVGGETGHDGIVGAFLDRRRRRERTQRLDEVVGVGVVVGVVAIAAIRPEIFQTFIFGSSQHDAVK